jgi:hypothetical protein
MVGAICADLLNNDKILSIKGVCMVRTWGMMIECIVFFLFNYDERKRKKRMEG